MTPPFKKLNLASQSVTHVRNEPPSFAAELAALPGVEVRREIKTMSSFVIAFAVTQAEADAASRRIAGCAVGDAIVSMACPKGASRKYKCDFDRDSLWSVRARASKK